MKVVVYITTETFGYYFGESKHRTMDITLPNHSGLFNTKL